MAPPIAFHAAISAGNAGASAYLHPLADRVQVNHILRGPAHAARALEQASGAPEDTSDLIERIASLATPTVAEVLRRYPNTIDGENRIAHLMHRLDVVLRHRPAPTAPGHGFESIDREKGNP